VNGNIIITVILTAFIVVCAVLVNNSETVPVSAVTTTVTLPETSPEAVDEPATEESADPEAGAASAPAAEVTAEPATEATAEPVAEATGSGETVSADTTPPVITLNGADMVSINVGGTYKDSGASAVDDVDGDISARIRTTSTLDSTQPGTYAVGYNVTDSAGNDAIAVYRFITVK